VTVVISGAPVFTNAAKGDTWTLNGTYTLSSPTLTLPFTNYSMEGFSDQDGDTCCVWNTQPMSYYTWPLPVYFSSHLMNKSIAVKGQKLFVSHQFPYQPPPDPVSNPFGYWERATASYTSANLYLNDTICRRQTSSGATEVSSEAAASVSYSGDPPSNPSPFTFSWKLTFPL
jgi:hypothetical protein